MRIHNTSYLVVALTLAACSEKKPAAPALQEVTIVASEFAFQAPDTIMAGVTKFRLVNKGQGLHHAQLVRLDSGKTIADVMGTMKEWAPSMKVPGWMVAAGGPNPPAPTEEAVTIQTMEPGNYAIICMVDVPDKVPHIMKGMAHGFTVVAAKGAAAAEPASDVTISLVDYAFKTSAPLTPGKHMLRLENGAQQPHELFLAKFEPGKGMKDFESWGATMAGPPPFHPMGGVAFLLPNAHVLMPVDLTAGDYVLVCFVPDAKDGKPHLTHGMVMPLKIG